MIKKDDLLVIGHTAIDYIMTVEKFPAPNSSTPIKTMKIFHGGAGANVAMVGAKLGLKTSLISAVGEKFLKSEYLEKMVELKINTDSMIISKNEDTPTAFGMTNNKEDQIFYFYWGAGKEFLKSDPPESSVQSCKAIHLATGDPTYNIKSSILGKNNDKIVSFDPGQDLNMYNAPKLKEVINNCTILFGNHHEIERIQNLLKCDINGLREIGPDIIVKTCGKAGSVIYTEKEKIKVDSIYRPAVDPTGAGDSYRAGFLYGYINEKSLENCAKFASAVSSFIVEKKGCQTNIPNFEQVTDRMNQFYNNKS
ncbi:putative ribokinase [Methanobrevibacter arboriphilus JCM 13429 = DSM 1125]|uniref:Putative ribokinase n=1 Tax=Methanobrevibacter arboriphilus JCM 13429 = DSM 1125 TaxID=1300164 RepID=A0A1V6N486_METAZ|nr:carbohydrate kinase family protein [Methanobrevibacter arboriphilus]OQD59491.1 putative ribokinase [Methanobrevibacter arboriphilus JCM 13429 = DSM 1125]